MRLAEFITANIEPILVEWEAFARSIWPPHAVVDPVELRNSAAEILRAVVTDMATDQSERERAEKSAGRGGQSDHSDRLDHASQVHGAARVGSGLALPAVVAEYRALRASVQRLWRQSKPRPDPRDLEDLTRFNEAIDQSLTLAVSSFMRRIETARSLFLGVLGHDIRNPLAAISISAQAAMAGAADPSELPRQMSQIVESARAISDLVMDLIDFTHSSVGGGLPLTLARADLHLLCNEVLRETRAAHPGREIRFSVCGDLDGTWDAHRLRQAVSNLLGNALQHGSSTHPVELTADGTDPRTVLIAVRNQGKPIPAHVLPTIFDPLVRGATSTEPRRTPGSIGLGLYIVREVAAAHGGTADLTSTPDGTTATVRLPRHPRG